MQKIKIIQFGSKTCAPCQALYLKLQTWLKDYPQIDFEYLDIAEARIQAAQANVLSVPTIQVYVNEQLFISESGYFSLEKILQQIERLQNLLEA